MRGGIPTPQDDNLQFQPAITFAGTSSGTGSAVQDLGTGFAPGGRGQPATAVVDVSALTGTGAYSVVLQDSPDGSNWTNRGAAVAITAVGVIGVDGMVVNEFVRLYFVLGETSPSITFTAWLNLHR